MYETWYLAVNFHGAGRGVPTKTLDARYCCILEAIVHLIEELKLKPNPANFGIIPNFRILNIHIIDGLHAHGGQASRITFDHRIHGFNYAFRIAETAFINKVRWEEEEEGIEKQNKKQL